MGEDNGVNSQAIVAQPDNANLNGDWSHRVSRSDPKLRRFSFEHPKADAVYPVDRAQSEGVPNYIQGQHDSGRAVSEYGDGDDVDQDDTSASGGSITSNVLSGNSNPRSKKTDSDKLRRIAAKARIDAAERRHSESDALVTPRKSSPATSSETKAQQRVSVSNVINSRLSRLSHFDASSLSTSNHGRDKRQKNSNLRDSSKIHKHLMLSQVLKSGKGPGKAGFNIAKGAKAGLGTVKAGFGGLKAAVPFKTSIGSAEKADGSGTDDERSSSGKNRWSFVVNMHNVKMKVPQKVRARRNQRRLSTSDGSLQPYRPPSRLHELCADPDVDLETLQTELSRHPEACSLRDSKGRLPIHWLGKLP
jgi:hypothetical protein